MVEYHLRIRGKPSNIGVSRKTLPATFRGVMMGSVGCLFWNSSILWVSLMSCLVIVSRDWFFREELQDPSISDGEKPWFPVDIFPAIQWYWWSCLPFFPTADGFPTGPSLQGCAFFPSSRWPHSWRCAPKSADPLGGFQRGSWGWWGYPKQSMDDWDLMLVEYGISWSVIWWFMMIEGIFLWGFP